VSNPTTIPSYRLIEPPQITAIKLKVTCLLRSVLISNLRSSQSTWRPIRVDAHGFLITSSSPLYSFFSVFRNEHLDNNRRWSINDTSIPKGKQRIYFASSNYRTTRSTTLKALPGNSCQFPRRSPAHQASDLTHGLGYKWTNPTRCFCLSQKL